MIGEVRLFAGAYEPRGWLFCDGRTLFVRDHVGLFGVLGARYGGDGLTNFKLPDLRGRFPLGAGAGPGLTERTLSQQMGVEGVRLEVGQIPGHRHSTRVVDALGDGDAPAGRFLARRSNAGVGVGQYRQSGPLAELDPASSGQTGGGGEHENMPPALVLNYIICVEGQLLSDPRKTEVPSEGPERIP